MNYSEFDIKDDYDKKFHRNKVVKELSYHIKDNKYSELFLDQLTQLHGQNYVKINDKMHPYNISQIYWMLEKIIKAEVKYKPCL